MATFPHAWRNPEALRTDLETLPDTSARSQSPAARLLDLIIGLYQRHISAGRNLCSRGPERNCSRLGRRAVRHRGALAGALAIIVLLFAPHEEGCVNCRCTGLCDE